MPIDISIQIEQLPNLRRDQLVPIRNEHFSTPPPATLRKELLVPILSYRIQEKLHGGLSMQARRRLQQVAQSISKGPRSSQRTKAPAPQGTRLLREWHGEMHEVWSTDEGFLYKGEKYGSLSKIATVITGTKWSGPAFFGVKK